MAWGGVVEVQLHVGDRLLTWVEWVSVVGTLLTVLGLAFTLQALRLARQRLKRVESASQASSRAVAATQAHLRKAYGVLLLPQLVDVQHDLVAAVGADAVEPAHRAIDRWIRLAGQLQTVLEEEEEGHPGLLTVVRESITRSTRAKNAMVNSRKPVDQATQRLRISVGEVCAYVGRLEGGLFAASNEGESR